MTEKGWLGVTVSVLLLLLLFQIGWFIGTTTLNDVERLQKDYAQLTEDIARIRTAGTITLDNPTSSVGSLIEPLNKKQDSLRPQMASALDAIKIWNRSWRWMIFWSQSSTVAQATNDEHGELRSAKGATQVLGLYILPLLYGWLGALLWVVQKLRENDNADALLKIKPASRVVTGMVAGPMIGMFLSPEFLNSLAFQATPFVIAFLGGYSTDIFFALIDRFMRTLRQALDPAKPQGGAAPVPAAGGGANAGGGNPP